MNRKVKYLIWSLAILGLLAATSYVTTGHYWDGGFPAGEVRVTVQGSAGQPIPGAIFRIYERKTRNQAFQYPITNAIAGKQLVSDQSGRIVLIQDREGLQFGGFAFLLFWCIPIGDRAPQYDCEIEASGYKPAKFDLWRLFDSPYTSYKDFPKTKIVVHGREEEVPVYEQKFVLER